jgi:hypothetical protein
MSRTVNTTAEAASKVRHRLAKRLKRKEPMGVSPRLAAARFL